MASFEGFGLPKQNWSKLPHEFVDAMHDIRSLAEIKVVIYVLRHTWGFAEYGKLKRITTDEFMNGRKRKDGSRIDKGTGMLAQAIRAGLTDAVAHGFLVVDVDDSDAARISKSYALNLREPIEMDDFHPSGDDNHPSGDRKSSIEQRKKPKIDKERKGQAAKNTPQPFTYKWPLALLEYGLTFENLFEPCRKPLDKSEYVMWMNGSRSGARGFTHYVKAGITPDEMRLAYEQMRRERLTVKNPNSLWAFAWDIHQRVLNAQGKNDAERLKKMQAERREEVEEMRRHNGG